MEKEKLEFPLANNPGERKNLELIKRHGWMVQSVLPGEDSPSFSYTIGLPAYLEVPELIIFGLGHEIESTILNEAVGQLEDFGKIDPDKLVKGYSTRIETVVSHRASLFMAGAEWFNRGKMPEARQIVWPDSNGRFPGEAGFDKKFLRLQPRLWA